MVLPSGLRRSYKVNSLEFPALPDQWLIVRYCRRGAELQTKAWFVDGGLVVDSDGPANLLFPAVSWLSIAVYGQRAVRH